MDTDVKTFLQHGENLKKMDTGSKHGKRFVFQQNENLKRMDTGTKKNKRFVFQHSESLKTMDTGKHGIDTAEK